MMAMDNHPDSKCTWGYMTLCDGCRPKAPAHVDTSTTIDGFLVVKCEICKKINTPYRSILMITERASSVKVVSSGTRVRGFRPDLIIIDDPMERESVVDTARLTDWYDKNIKRLVTPSGKQVPIMDLHQWLNRDEPKEMDDE